ncbi:hypothetical protein [Candidatus Nitrospira bockiana]
MKTFLAKFMEQGLLWAIIVWAAAVALMAINIPDAFWRWSFLALSAAGIGLVVLINWARKKLVMMGQASKDRSEP